MSIFAEGDENVKKLTDGQQTPRYDNDSHGIDQALKMKWKPTTILSKTFTFL